MPSKHSSSGSPVESRPHAPRTQNRQAFREYHIIERVEAGLVLTGTEVKSLRAGKCQLDDAYARIEGGQVFLVGADIAIYPQAVGSLQHEPKRTRKCLLHNRQIEMLTKLTAAKGMTIVPLALYFRNGYAKVELGVGHGKQTHDKRQDLKERQARRDIDREMRRRR
jgi:SsrA-binding protein